MLLMPNTLALFMRLLFTASFKNTQYATKHGPVQLNRGQGICAIRPLSDEMKQSVKQIRTALDKLEKLQIVALEKTHLWTVYTIVNYDKYQDSSNEEAQITAQDGHSKGTDRAQDGHSKGTDRAQEEELKNLRTKELKELKEGKAKTLTPAALLASLEIPEALALDFAKLRQAKKSPITKTAMDGIAREAQMANITFLDAITICCERGWAGFKAEWFFKDGAKVADTASDCSAQAERVRIKLFGGINAS